MMYVYPSSFKLEFHLKFSCLDDNFSLVPNFFHSIRTIYCKTTEMIIFDTVEL